FVYVTDTLKARLPQMVQWLRELTGIEDWVGTVGLGVMAGGQAAFGEPAVAVMIANWPKEHYKLFHGVPSEPWPPPATGPMGGMMTALVHADPRNRSYPNLLQALCSETGAYLIGGVTASRNGHCDQVAGSALAEGGISGVLAGPVIRRAAGVSQGCTAAGPVRTITAGERNIIVELDGQPPLDALFQDLNLAGAEDID